MVVHERLGDPRRGVDADQANAFRHVGGEAVCRSSRHREYVSGRRLALRAVDVERHRPVQHDERLGVAMDVCRRARARRGVDDEGGHAAVAVASFESTGGRVRVLAPATTSGHQCEMEHAWSVRDFVRGGEQFGLLRTQQLLCPRGSGLEHVAPGATAADEARIAERSEML